MCTRASLSPITGVMALAIAASLPDPVSAQGSPLERGAFFTTLENGLQVIVVDNPTVPLATALIAIRNGAFTQDSADAGLAHLYEHLLFRSFRGDPLAFGRETAKLNGAYNGGTSEEVVTYYVMVPSQHIESAIRLLADLLRKARFSNGDLRDERPVVLDELRRGESDPQQGFQRSVERMLWGPAWHRKDVGGDSTSIRAISLERLRETYARYYIPNNAALIVTGDVTRERILQAAQRSFGEWPAGSDPFADKPIPPIPPRATSSAVLVVADVQDVTIVVALQGPGVSADPDATYAADVLFDVFNDPASAFQRRLVDAGPFRSISGHYRTLDHTGPIEIRGTTMPQEAQRAVMALLAELDSLDRLDGLTDEDLEFAKKRRQVASALARERTAGLAPNLAYWWSAAGLEYYRTYHDRMAAQTADDLRLFARRYVVQRPRVIGVLGAPAVVDQLQAWLRQGVRRPSP